MASSERMVSYAERTANLAEKRARAVALAERFGNRPVVRQRPRLREEAEWLRSIGTPERLIGPDAKE